MASIPIRDATDDDVIVSIAASVSSIAEGDNAVFTLTRTGDTASTLTATVRVVDPDQVMRGNHWDPALPAEDFTKSVTFAAGAETATVSFPTRPNVRDTDDLTLTAEVRQDEGYNYWVGATFAADVTVTDDDTAPEFSLSVSPAAINEGEDVTFTLTRHGDVSQALEEVPFVLRIGADHRRFLWPDWVEPQDYGAAMDAGRSARDYSFTVHQDGSYNDHGSNFRYEAEFKPADGIPDAHLAEYFTVRGERKVGASVRNVSRQQVWIASIGDDTFEPNDEGGWISHENYTEGQEVPFVIGRSGSAEQIAEELVVQFRYFEIDHPYHRGSYVRPGTYYNPSDQRFFMTFPAGETRVGGSFVIYVDDLAETTRTNYFLVYFPRVPYVDYWSYQKLSYDGHGGPFRDNPRGISIALAEDDSNTIEEGETAEFVLTRGGSTDRSLTLDVAIDDPGDFRRGNHWMNTPDRTVAVTFDAGSDTAALSVPTSDDWRDIPNNTITATIPPSQDGSYRPAYETEGETSASVTVEDNDVAPNITLTASATTVVEGTAATFTLTRNDTDNRLVMRFLFGVQGEEQYQTYIWDETKSRITVDVDTEEDDYDDPDEIVYVLSMLPLTDVPQDELDQYWTVEGPSSATITVTDNDLPLVGVDEVEQSYQERGYGHVRFVRDGQTGDVLPVKYIITQDGNSLFVTDRIGVEQTIEILAGEESSLTTHLLSWSDGDEDDTTLTITAVADTEQYRIDPERASATFTVTDRDPLPVLSISDATASEGDGTIDFQVSVTSSVYPPSRREISVVHYTQSGSAEPGEDYTATAAFLIIPPLATSAVISIPVLDDALAEEEESFTLILNFPQNAELQDGQGTLRATGTITDDEPTVSVSAVSDEVDEGDTAVLEFVRTGTTTEALTVYYARTDELLFPAGARVVRATQSLEIAAGNTSAQLSIETEDDRWDTVDRLFGISVVSPTGEGLTRYYGHEPTTAWVTVKDDDLPSVSVVAESEGVHESYDADFTLSRLGRIDIPLTVNITVTREGSFFPNGDPPSTVTFTEGSSTATLTLATVGDSTLEDHGSVKVAIAEGDDYKVGLPDNATTAIADNDRSGVSVSIAGENAAVDEGENVVFTVTRTGGKDLDAFTVRVNVYEVRDSFPWSGNEEKLAEFVDVDDGFGLEDSDGNRSLYSENQYDVEFAAGSATATITIPTEDEIYNDGNSYFRADIPLSGSYQVDPFPGRAEVWVRDDDIPTVHVTPENYTVVEDGVYRTAHTFHRTGDTSTRLWVNFGNYELVRSVHGHDRFPDSGLLPVRRPILGGSVSSRPYITIRFFFAPIDGMEAYVLLQPHYCETVPGDCGTAPQYRVGSPSSSFITILNDAQGVRIEADRESVTEGEAATFTLTRHGSTTNARIYPLGVRVGVTQDGQFIDGVPPQTVTFDGHPNPTSLTATVSIPTLDDDVYEAGGSIEVAVLPSTGIPLISDFIYEVSSPASASVTVADNDPPAFAISDASASEDAGTMQFTVSVPAAYGRLTVDWETSDGSGDDAATAGSDYEAASGQVVFNDGEAERTISVNITDDSDEEGNETFTLTLKNPVGLVLPADPTATGTILDDDGSAGGPMIGELPSGVDVTITAAESSVEEGAAATFTITRAQGSGAQSDSWSSDPLSVSLALSQEGDFFSPSSKNFSGAAVSYDIASATADVTIPAGQLSVTLDLATDDDDVAEADGSITLTVAEGTGYEVGFPAIATTNVTDNDVGISISGVTQGEDKAEMTFTVSLSRSAGEAVTVVASTMDGTATSDAAVTATSLGKDFEAKTETLTISAGDTEANFTVTLLDDTIDEHAEEFTVALSSPSDNAVLLDESATGAIEDNDDPMMVGVHRVGRTVNENAEGPVVFRFQTAPQADSATTATERAITVRWTVLPGTATAGEDYVAVADPEETEIPVGLTTRSVEVTLTDDSLFEAIEETFTFEIKGAVNAVKNTDHESIEMSIRDDEGMRADVLPVSPVVAEGEDAVFIVLLSESVSIAPVEITYSVVGTAGPSDYVAPSGTLIIPVGATSGAITIATVADEIADGDETLGVLLTRATTKAREVFTPEEQLLVTVLDANTLSASFVSGASAEEGKVVVFIVRLSIASDQTVRVTWETEDVKGREATATATANVDYTSSTGVVEILAGDTSAAFTVGTTQDSLYEGDEVFGAKLIDALRVENDDSVVEIPLGTSHVVGAILDDDAQPTDIKLTATPATVNEGAGETEFTVTGTLTGSTRLTGDVEITLNLEGSVSEDEDVDDTEPATLTISAGQASGTTTIAATPLDDEVDDDGASIRITGTSDGFDVAQAVVTVTDDDGPPTGVTLSLSQSTIGEGDGETELTVTATLTGGGLRTEDTQVVLSVEGVSIPSTVEGEDPSVAAGSNDFTAPDVTLTIPARERSGTAIVTITPVDDNLTEGSETAQISGENDDLDVTPARLTIEDNDQDATGIRLSVSPASITEKDGAEEIEVTATLTGGGVRMTATTVVLTVADVSAITGIDYTAATTNLVIPGGQLSGVANVSINLIDDDLDEPIKRVAIRGTNDDPGLPVRGARVSILDDDLPPTGIVLSVNRSTVQENLGGQALQVTAEIQGNRRSTKTVVSLATANGTAHSTDYRPSQGLLTIPAGARTGSAPFLVEPIDDQLDEDDETLSIGGSPSLRSLNVQSAVITITDDDTAGVAITPNALTIAEGNSGSYRVALQTQPSETVTVTVTGQAGTDLTLDKTTLTFTDSNWGTPQALTVTAGDDADGANDSVTLTHTAAGGEYEDLAADLSVTVVDNDTASVVLSETTLSVDEGDDTGVTYTVKLATQPSAEVTVTVTGQANTDLSITGLSGTGTLTFTTENWDTAQTVTVTAAEDADGADDSVTLTHTAAGGNYAGETADLAVTVVDDDTASVVLTPTTLSVDEGNSAGASYTVELATQPSAEVTVTVTGQANTDLTLTGLSGTGTLTFTASTWDTAQTVTVTAGHDDDGADDGATLTHTAAGGEYADVAADLAVTVVDDDRAIVLTPTTLSVGEGDDTGATYTVKLATQPSEEVTVTVTGHSGSDLTLTGLSATDALTFTTDNWDTAQTVTVTAGHDDDGADDSETLTHTAAGGEYAGETATLPVTVVDDDRAIVLSPKTSLSVDEGDDTGATYTVKLATQPSAEVTVTVTGQASTDLTLTGLSGTGTLIFTTDNWNTAQTVTVKAGQDADGVDDAVTLTHTATGGNYAGETATLAVTVDDDETVSVVLSKTALSVDEGDDTAATYTVKLATQPSETVTVTVTGQTNTDLTLTGLSGTGTLTFTTENWDTAQTVTVTAGHDADGADDSVTLTHTAAGGEYASVAATLPVTVVDDDRGIVLSRTSLSVDEGGATGATYTVKLATQPSAEVIVAVTGQANTDLNLTGLSGTSTLTFTTDNWDTAQTVTVTAGQDADGADDAVTLTHTATGGNYAGETADLTVTVDDDETVSVVLSETALSVDEGDDTGASYTVKLSHLPSEQVTVTVTGHANTDLTLNKTTLTFTTSNWNTAQTVTVKAQDDTDGDDDSVTLTHTAAGGEYASVTATLPVMVVDDDKTLIIVPTALTVQAGGSNSYTVVLGSQLAGDVTVSVSGHSGTDLTLDKTALTFTISNWNTAQTVSVTGDANASKAKVTLSHETSSDADPGYHAISVSDVEVSLLAKGDKAQIQIGVDASSRTLTVAEGGSNTYSLVLSHLPGDDVSVVVNDPTDNSDVTTSPASLTFTTSNWNILQTVTVSAEHDADGADDLATVTHSVSGGGYDGITSPDVSVTVVDDDRAIVLSKTALSVAEGSAAGATYTVKLATQPSETVTVAVTGHTGTDVSVNKASLTFTTDDWSTAQTVTVTVAEDADGSDDTVTLTHTATGGNYAGETAKLSVTVDDDETVSVVLSEAALSVDEGGAAGATYTVKLSHLPSEQVTVTVTGHAGTDLTLNKTTLTFTTSNWNTAQTVTVTAAHDDDGADDAVTLTHTATGGEYAGATADLPVTVVDDDRGIVLTPTTLSVAEGDATGATYTVKLATQPSTQVTVAISGHTGTDVSVDTASLTFTTDDWSTAQTVKVTAAEDDDGADDSVTLTHTATGGNYAGETATLAVTVDDDETVSVVLSEAALSVDEGDDTESTYTVKLATQPSAQVTVAVTGHSGTDVSVDKASLTFTTGNWDTAQTVKVTAAEDADGADDSVTLTHTATGGDYAGETATLAVTVDDDETVSVVLSKTALSVGEGDATGSDYTVKLSHQPSENVTVTVTGHTSTDLGLDKTTLTFTTSNWDTAQTVTVTGGQDDDGADDTETLTHTAAGGEYALVTADLPVTVVDDDKSPQISATVSFADTNISVAEGATTTVSVQLSPSLSEAITVGLTTTNQSGATNADYSGVPATLAFASGDTTKSFTFIAETDLVDELDEVVVIGFGTLPEGLGAGSDNQATITIRDATSISISFDSAAYSATEGGSDATVTVELSAAPAQQVEITLTASGHDGATSGDWSGVPSSLTFGSGETSKSFTVTAVDDTVEDDGEMVELGFGSLPEGFVSGAHATARVTLMNDDRQDQEETDTEQPAVTCDDADRYTEADIVVDNNGKELPDQADNTRGYVPVLEVGHTLEGYIAPCDDWDMFAFELEEGKYYRLDYLGASSSDGTLSTPNILGLFTDGPDSSRYGTEAEPVWYRYSDGKRPFTVYGADNRGVDTVWVDPGAERQNNWSPLTQGNSFGGLGDNACQYLMHFPAGTYYALLIGGQYSIGTYRIRLTEVSDDDSGIRTLTLGNQATGSLDYVGDEDVFELDLVAGKTYKITIQKKGPSWKDSSTSPFFSTVEDVDASTVTSFPFLGVTSMREISFTAATTGVHRFTIEGHTAGTSTYFADGEYGLTVTELIPVPSAPQNLTVSSLTHDSVTLTWEAPEDSVVESYQILRRFLDDREYGDHYGSTKFVVIADEIGSGETSYTDTSVEPRTRYVYRMKARNERGLGERSNYANADTPTENSAATGAPTISGTAQVGQTLAADVTGIADEDGLDDASFAYQWVGSDEEDIQDATNASYMLGASDQGKSIKVRVDFTDDAGHQESLTSEPVGPVDHQTSQQRINSPPTGAPTISGTVQVEETLTADVTGIADEDGLDDASFAYQWVRSDGSDEEDIQDATGSTYHLTEDDLGKTIKVRVSFTDDAGSEESLTSAPTATVIAAVPGAPQSLVVQPSATGQLAASWQAPASDGGAEITGYTVQWKVATNSWDTAEDVSSAATTETSFTITSLSLGTEYSVRVIAANSVGDGEASEEVIETAVALTSEQQEAAQNNPATGMPTIRGTAQVGETLTADTSGISDEDGLTNPTFSYQWVRNDGSTDTGIRDATFSTYTLTPDEEGKTLKVKVSFTDDAGNEETLTSAATAPLAAAAAPNSAATGQPQVVGSALVGASLSVDTSGIADADGLSGAQYRYQWLTSEDGANTEIADATGSSYRLTWREDGKSIKVRVSFTDDAGYDESLTSPALHPVRPTGLRATVSGQTIVLNWEAPSGFALLFDYRIVREAPKPRLTIDTRSQETSYTDSDVEPGVLYRYRVQAANYWNQLSPASEAVEILMPQAEAVANTPATGQPTISGTPQVGQTLAAGAGGISDENGLDDVSYAYQWLADDVGIAGATNASYTLTSSEEGKTIKVRVDFTDDGGNGESLTSGATDAVESAGPTEPPPAPQDLTATVNEDGSITLSWSASNDDSATGYQIMRRRPREGENTLLVYVANTGGTATTFTDTNVEAGKLYVYRVKAINEAGVGEQSPYVNVET